MIPAGRTSFPGLSTAMDIKAMTASFRQVLKNEDPCLDIVGGRIGDVRYDANKQQYIILYHLRLQNNSTNRRRKKLFTARVLTEEAFSRESKGLDNESVKLQERRSIQKPCFLLTDQAVILYPFPHDPAMTWLPDAVDPSVIKKQLNRIWTRRNLKVRKVKIETLGFTPQMRASFYYDILVEDKTTKESLHRHLIAKTNLFKDPERLFAAAWALWQVSGHIGFARPVGFLTNPRLTLQEKIPGVRLGSLVSSPSFDTILSHTAQTIARFHSLSVPLQSKRRLKDEARSIDRWSNVITQIRPDLRRRVEPFRRHLIDEITARMCIRTPVHADFHHTNILVEGKEVFLIDLDEVALGDPCVDIGRFLASLRIPSLRAFGNIEKLNKARRPFLEEYLKIRKEDVSNIHLFESAGLLVAAASAFRIQRPNWKEEAGLLLEEAERVFHVSKMRRRQTPPPAFEKPRLSVDERSRWSLDETYMNATLSPVIQDQYGAELVACKLTKRKKLQKNPWVEYALAGWMQDKRWKSKAFGLILDKEAGPAVFSHLLQLRQALKETDAEKLLPRPLAYLRHMGMLVFESVTGKTLTALVGDDQGADAAARLAKALSALHRAGVEPSKAYSVHKELKKTRKKLDRFKRDHSVFYEEASALWAEIETLMKCVTEKTSPVLYSLGPRGVLCSNNHVTVTDLTKVRFSHPYLDVGNFLCRLMVVGIKQDRLDDVMAVAQHFRASYQAASGEGRNGFQGFEAAALVRMACNHVRTNRDDGLASRLLWLARERISDES